jgi:hypothetical protein
VVGGSGIGGARRAVMTSMLEVLVAAGCPTGQHGRGHDGCQTHCDLLTAQRLVGRPR